MRSTGAQVGDVGYVEPAPNRVGGVSGCNGGAGGLSVPFGVPWLADFEAGRPPSPDDPDEQQRNLERRL
jgi:hypothetical protein